MIGKSGHMTPLGSDFFREQSLCYLFAYGINFSFYIIPIAKLVDSGHTDVPNSYQSILNNMDRVKRIWYLSPMRAAKVQASLRIRAVSPEPSLLAHISSESRGTFRQKARSLAPLSGWACAVEICHDGMLEDTNSLDAAHIVYKENITFLGDHCRLITLNSHVLPYF